MVDTGKAVSDDTSDEEFGRHMPRNKEYREELESFDD